MKKSLRVFVVLSVVASTVFSLQPAKAIGFAFDTVGVLTSAQISSCEIDLGPGNSFKFTANVNTTISKVQVYVGSWGGPAYDFGAKIYHDASNSPGALLGELSTTTHPSILYESGIITFVASSPLEIDSGSIYWLEINSGFACARTSSTPTYTGSDITTIYNGNTIRMFRGYAGYSDSVSVMFAIFTTSLTPAPGSPSSVVATATGKRSATVSFAAPDSNGGSAITSYTATATPGGITQTLTQVTSSTFTFDGLQPGTAYAFAVTATNATGTSAAGTSNSIKTLALDVASISALSFADDGTGTGGKIVWAGTSIDAVLYTGSSAFYPGPYNYGAFTSGWNGRIRNLTPGTEYTVSLFVVSADGVGESKSLIFKTSATLPALAGSTNSTISQAAQMATELPKLFAWISENVFVDGEGDRMKTALNKFDAIKVPTNSAYLRLPNPSVLSVSATSSTPAVCAVEGQVTVHSIAAGTCTISYAVSGGSKAPATLVKDFVFKKFAK